MYKQKANYRRLVTFRQLNRKAYSVFRSLKREIRIGVLSFATLTYANVESVSAQTVNHSSEQTESTDVEMQELEVTASRVPLTLNQAARTLTVIDRATIAAAPVQSVNDLLKYVIGVDVRQRGEQGIQTDISIRGGTFDQITLLLNGVNVCDAQTGHNAADFPVDLKDIERIEVLEGPAGRAYGTSSLLGAINIVTRTDRQSHATVHVEGGSYGLASGGARLNLSNPRISNQLSANYSRSDGATENSDFNTLRAYYQGCYSHPTADLQWQAGLSRKDYGANTFYSAKYPNQYEETRKYFASAQAETKGFIHFLPQVYWTQAYDHFELSKGDATVSPFNDHRTTTCGLNLNSYVTTRVGKTALGAEMRNEDVVSTVLGEPLSHPKKVSGRNAEYTRGRNRTNVSLHAEHTLLLSRLSISAGFVATMNTNWDKHFHLFPGVDASYWLTSGWKVYASWNTSLRMPTFTELYYTTNATHQGNKDLRPEKMQAYEVGMKYVLTGFESTLSVYHHRGKGLIDWVRPVDETVYYSMNHTRINTTGFELSAKLDFGKMFSAHTPLQTLYVGYSYIDRSKCEEAEYESAYALEYLRHKLMVRLSHRICGPLSAEWAFRLQDRMGSYTDYSVSASGQSRPYKPYALLDAKLQWSASACQLFVEATNLFNRHYYDHGNVPQPGLQFRVGVSYRFDL